MFNKTLHTLVTTVILVLLFQVSWKWSWIVDLCRMTTVALDKVSKITRLQLISFDFCWKGDMEQMW